MKENEHYNSTWGRTKAYSRVGELLGVRSTLPYILHDVILS